jgi:hypothetical protein
MSAVTFACPKCQSALNVEPGIEEISASCPNCTAELYGYFFPAFFRPASTGRLASALADHTEASCFYHPLKQAVRVCDGCGRLVCALCDIELGAEHLCPNCISAGRKKGKITTLEDSRTRYDSIALTLAIIGIIPFFMGFSIFLAPAALYLSIRYWNSPGSIFGASRTRFVIAIVLAILELLFWSAILLFMFFGPHPRR